MYPVLIKFGPISIPSYGFMLAIAFIVGITLFSRDLKRRNMDPNIAYDLGIAAIIGGVVGARTAYVLGHLGDAPFMDLVLRGGLAWFGGLIGATILTYIFAKQKKLPIPIIADGIAPAIAIGHVFGRIGCLLNGDDYGVATTLPWAMSFPSGAPPTTQLVHPTQIYEATLHLGIFIIILAMRNKLKDGNLFILFLLLAGTERFFIEFIRTNEIIVGNIFTIHHFVALALVIGASTALLVRKAVVNPETVKNQ